jgi:riboflavin biosynthesis pyrimidine reductase
VIILTTAEAAATGAARRAVLEQAGATVLAVDTPGIFPALRELASNGIQSLLVEGGPALHAALWDEGAVDYVTLYVAPIALGPAGLPLLDGRPFSSAALFDRRVHQLGPDVLIEGYVHRPH